MTIVPNLLVTGILAILVSLIFLVWATVFIERKNGGLVLILLSIVMLLVGGGFGPPLLGIIIGVTGTRINAPLTWWRTHLSIGSQHFLGKLWPWFFAASLIAWLLLFPGSILLDYFFGVNNPAFIPIVFFLLSWISSVDNLYRIRARHRRQTDSRSSDKMKEALNA